jgi:hypothetical protein
MVISAGNSPKVLLKLQGASLRRARACVGYEEFTAGYSKQHFHKLAANLMVGLNDS